jgi:hypothetical protein
VHPPVGLNCACVHNQSVVKNASPPLPPQLFHLPYSFGRYPQETVPVNAIWDWASLQRKLMEVTWSAVPRGMGVRCWRRNAHLTAFPTSFWDW